MKELFKYYLSIYYLLLPVVAYALFVGITVKEGSILGFFIIWIVMAIVISSIWFSSKRLNFYGEKGDVKLLPGSLGSVFFGSGGVIIGRIITTIVDFL